MMMLAGRFVLMVLSPNPLLRLTLGRLLRGKALKHFRVVAMAGEGAAVLVEAAHGAVVTELRDLGGVATNRLLLAPHPGRNVLHPVMVGERGPDLVAEQGRWGDEGGPQRRPHDGQRGLVVGVPVP